MPSSFPAVFFALNGRKPGAGFTTARDFDISRGGSEAASMTRKLESRLVDAIRDSVRRCYRTSEDTFLSLSVGYDSAAIMGALPVQRLDAQTFTYGRTDPPRWSDTLAIWASLWLICAPGSSAHGRGGCCSSTGYS